MEHKFRNAYSSGSSTAQLSGLEIIQGIKDGILPPPPIAKLMNFTLYRVSRGCVVFKGIPLQNSTNPMGTVHGGWYGTILDSAMACTIITDLPPGKQFTTLEFKINLIRSIPLNTEVFAKGKIVHKGKTTAVAEAKIYDSNDKIYSLGSSTGMIFETKF